MDLNDILAKEIAKKKAAIETTKRLKQRAAGAVAADGGGAEGQTKENGNNVPAAVAKYIRRGDLERLQEDELRQKQATLNRERAEREEKRRREDIEREGKSEKLKQEEKKSVAGGAEAKNEFQTEDTLNIPPEEVVRRLRARGQPIRLFAEADKARKIRLRALELMEERTEGQRNDFMRTLGQYETKLDLEALKRQAGETAEELGRKKRRKEEGPTLEDTKAISIELLQKDPDRVYTLVYLYLKRLLKEWELELRNQPDDARRSNQGKLAAAMQKQSAEYIKPFFRLLKRKEVEADIMGRITEIIHFMHKREYVNANDAYLRLSIGNAPWPIGVTMVGIHERSSREKIFSSSVAHVLNDEQARKWIQSIKRIMTFCQSKYPPADNAQLF